MTRGILQELYADKEKIDPEMPSLLPQNMHKNEKNVTAVQRSVKEVNKSLEFVLIKLKILAN